MGLRVDDYSTFGHSVSPSFGAAVQATSSLQVHASASRAFRVPTFTELYYTDPNNLGTPDLVAEHGWSLDRRRRLGAARMDILRLALLAVG